MRLVIKVTLNMLNSSSVIQQSCQAVQPNTSTQHFYKFSCVTWEENVWHSPVLCWRAVPKLLFCWRSVKYEENGFCCCVSRFYNVSYKPFNKIHSKVEKKSFWKKPEVIWKPSTRKLSLSFSGIKPFLPLFSSNLKLSKQLLQTQLSFTWLLPNLI